MQKDAVFLWEILVPTVRYDGTPYKTRFYKVWDKKIQEISGGLTVLTPVKGRWVSPNQTFMTERMIPVRVACSEAQIREISDFTARHYRQIAVMYYRISDYVVIAQYPTSGNLMTGE